MCCNEQKTIPWNPFFQQSCNRYQMLFKYYITIESRFQDKKRTAELCNSLPHCFDCILLTIYYTIRRFSLYCHFIFLPALDPQASTFPIFQPVMQPFLPAKEPVVSSVETVYSLPASYIFAYIYFTSRQFVRDLFFIISDLFFN